MPRIVDPIQVRRELLGRCFDLFARKGYSALTTRELCQELGISMGTLYHYFPSKAALFEQLVEDLVQRDVLQAAKALVGAETVEERFTLLGEFLGRQEDFCTKNLAILVDYCQHQSTEERFQSPFWRRVHNTYRQAVTDLLGITDPHLVSFVTSHIDGVFLARLMGNSQVSMREQMQLLGRLLAPLQS